MLKPLLISLSLLAANAQAVVLSFDDVPSQPISLAYYSEPLPAYQGFNFSSTVAWVSTVTTNWNYGAHSGNIAIINNINGTAATITAANDGDFTFDGLWAKRWATNAQSGGADSLFGTLSGYNNGQLVWSVNTALNGSYRFFDPQAGAIDELVLDFGRYFLVDDLALTSLPVSNVPEPGTLALTGAALALLAARRRFSRA